MEKRCLDFGQGFMGFALVFVIIIQIASSASVD